MEHVRLRISGFDQHRFLSACLAAGIAVYEACPLTDLELELTVRTEDLKTVKRLCGNKYACLILHHRGPKSFLKRLFARKTTIAGLILFVVVIWFQSLFVSEIRISGYEALTEQQLRDSLRLLGLYEGCSKKIDPETVEYGMYREYDEIGWIDIRFDGSLVRVRLAENKTYSVEEKTENYACANIVATTDGYVDEINVRKGVAAVVTGSYVREGDILISGTVPMNDSTYSKGENPVHYVCADGDVFLKKNYRIRCRQTRLEAVKTPTGRHLPGVCIAVGQSKLDTGSLFRPFEVSVETSRELFSFVRPFPLSLSVSSIKEAELAYRERSQKEIESLAKTQMRGLLKEKIPKDAEIINNSLKFESGENIIEVTAMVETKEKNGKTVPFTPSEAASGQETEEEGNVRFGESSE